ncbi:8261_t:CDS:2 [Racocetra fulgida]|uniref:8261_t:CDS:1 n=1 Tax=Racocetra fulgida TaxID=60492 RepID=A0A9N9GLV2_9GLOM|nr:8261_t:CDS:2 [Racocetra fulgida]
MLIEFNIQESIANQIESEDEAPGSRLGDNLVEIDENEEVFNSEIH